MNKVVTIIQKVQIVIKPFIIILVGMLCCNSNAQTNLIGTFCIDYTMKDFFNCLTFQKEKNFKYKYGGDTGMFEYGQGKYKFKGNKLILNYNKTEPIKIGYHLSKIWTNSKDSINLKINIFNFDSIPLPSVSIVYKDSLSKYGYGGVSANEKGIASVDLKRDRTTLRLTVSHIGYRQYEFEIDKNYIYDISIFLQKEGYGLPILNKIDTLIIYKKRPKYFSVKNRDGTISIWKKLID
ncbi:hypothetical protein [uncultured Lutibacter sp.]|uniref:hypothetical protein n=1 Tax=uncultured Lutibacter sp. TaxID=437739 RepID=UPI0026123353|nr:hypothetical protein [uncultured Lutibacter sp.]